MIGHDFLCVYILGWLGSCNLTILSPILFTAKIPVWILSISFLFFNTLRGLGDLRPLPFCDLVRLRDIQSQVFEERSTTTKMMRNKIRCYHCIVHRAYNKTK